MSACAADFSAEPGKSAHGSRHDRQNTARFGRHRAACHLPFLWRLIGRGPAQAALQGLTAQP